MTYEAYARWKREPIQDRPLLSIIIPAYNEEIRIVPTIGAIAAFVSDLGFEWELIVADDGSTDQTVDLVRSLELVNLRVLEAPGNAGKGSAVRRGIQAARGTYRLFADADFSTPIAELTRLMDALDADGFDVAIGSRAADGAIVENRSGLRQALSAGLSRIVRGLLGLQIRDTQCGFKLFRGHAADELFARQTIDGFAFDLELLFIAKRHGLAVVEVPVTWYEAPFSKVDSVREPLRFLRAVVEIRWNALRGAYARTRPAPDVVSAGR